MTIDNFEPTMINERMLQSLTDETDFCKTVKSIIKQNGVCHVELRDKTIAPILYKKESDDCCDLFIHRDLVLSWYPVGKSLTSRDYDMMRIVDGIHS